MLSFVQLVFFEEQQKVPLIVQNKRKRKNATYFSRQCLSHFELVAQRQVIWTTYSSAYKFGRSLVS